MLKQILFIWLCFSALTLFGQSLIDIKYYSVQDGLSQKNIQNLIQDDNGYIWMSTWNGLERFDGYSFTNYKTYPGSKVRIANHRFTKIEKSSLNNVWCQTYDKHCYLFNTRTYQYEDPFLFNKSLVNSVEKLYVLREGITWAVGTQNELFRMDENKFPDMESVQLYTGKTENSIGDSIYTCLLYTSSRLVSILPFFNWRSIYFSVFASRFSAKPVFSSTPPSGEAYAEISMLFSL